MNQTAGTGKGRGRPASFDKDKLVEAVMHRFWEVGYNNLSLSEIAQDAGLTRASLYNTFKSKENLFLLSLQQYLNGAPDAFLADLQEDASVGEAFLKMFNESSRNHTSSEKRRGCFLTSCINELMTDDTPLKDYLSDLIKQRKELLTGLIERAVSRKELPEDSDVPVLVNMMMSFMYGFATYSKTGATEEEMSRIGRSFLEQLGFRFE